MMKSQSRAFQNQVLDQIDNISKDASKIKESLISSGRFVDVDRHVNDNYK